MGQGCSSPFACCSGAVGSTRDNILGSVIKHTIQSFDKDILGVDVTVGSMNIHAHKWRLEIEDLILQNPEGFKSPYLLRVKKANADLDGATLVTSFGKSVIVEELNFDGVELIYEPKLGSSNVKVVKQHIKQCQEDAQRRGLAPEEDNSKKAPPKEEEKAIEPIVQKVALSTVSARMHVHGFGPTVNLKDIKYDNFSQEFAGAHAVMDVINILVSTLLKSALHTIKDNVHNLGSGILSSFKSLAGKTKELAHRGHEKGKDGKDVDSDSD